MNDLGLVSATRFTLNARPAPPAVRVDSCSKLEMVLRVSVAHLELDFVFSCFRGAFTHELWLT